METKQTKPAITFMPRTMGVFVLLIIVLSFVAGAIRKEMILTLTGSVFLAVWIYCLAMTLLLALIHRRRAGKISIRLSPEKIIAGDQVQVIFSQENNLAPNRNFLQLPGILVRCCVRLFSKDGRRITHDFKPEKKIDFTRQESFPAEKRGAYFSHNDELVIFDILGFFRFIYRIPVPASGLAYNAPQSIPIAPQSIPLARLLVSPNAAGEPVPIKANGGESQKRDAPPIERADELIDQRPYVPGDDPRRINWKLYSHGGELFIRQGEREPPPHSNITILIDTQFDSLYTENSACAAVDLLCENALAIINSAAKDRNIQIGFTGQTEKSGSLLTAAELGFFLAYPWAQQSIPFAQLSVIEEEHLPAAPYDSAVVILALPRLSARFCALERFLSDNANRSAELIFIYGADENDRGAFKKRAAAAQICASLYNKRPGVRVSIAACLPAVGELKEYDSIRRDHAACACKQSDGIS